MLLAFRKQQKYDSRWRRSELGEPLFFGTGTKTLKVHFKLKRDLCLPTAKAAASTGTYESEVRSKGGCLERCSDISPKFQILPSSH